MTAPSWPWAEGKAAVIGSKISSAKFIGDLQPAPLGLYEWPTSLIKRAD
jgi:hypothetical protein